MSLDVLRAHDVDDYRREIESGRVDGVLHLAPVGISLAAAIELACWYDAYGSDLDPRVAAHLERWRRAHRAFELAFDALRGRTRNTPDDFATVRSEVRAVPSRDEFAGRSSAWGLFGMRFARALREIGGFDAKLARALNGALNELVDNVLDHSAPLGATPCPGVVGYNVIPGRVSFAVGDTGQGVLASLVTNPRHALLKHSQEALRAVVQDRATRRTSVAEGNGIKQVFASLASLQGELRFRSMDAVLTVRGEGDFYRLPLNLGSCPRLAGFQVSVICSTQEGPFTQVT